MFKLSRHILFVSSLLMAFIGGQIVLCVHQHEVTVCCGETAVVHRLKGGYHAKADSLKNCLLCDAIVHKKILTQQLHSLNIYFRIVRLSVIHVHEAQFFFTQLLQARGRLPMIIDRPDHKILDTFNLKKFRV